MARPGSLEQRGENSWRLIAFVGVDPETKKSKYAKKTFRGTKRDAARALTEFVVETNRQRDAGVEFGARATVADVLNTWLEARRLVLAPATVDRYRVAILHVNASRVGALPVMKLRPHHIEDLYSEMLENGQSGSSIRKVHWALRQALAWAHRRGYTALVATQGIELPPLGEREINPPSSEDVRKLLDHVLSADPEWGTMIAFVAWTGCRRGEVCGLRWTDIDLDRKSVLIARSVAAVPGGAQVKGTKTGDIRRIALGTKSVALLRDLRTRCQERAEASLTLVQQDGYVFSPSVSCDRPYNPHTLTNVFVKACRAAGGPHMRLHDLRHHSATGLLKNGSSVGEVMDRHGWRSVSMVNRYRHLLDASDAATAEAIENLGVRP